MGGLLPPMGGPAGRAVGVPTLRDLASPIGASVGAAGPGNRGRCAGAAGVALVGTAALLEIARSIGGGGDSGGSTAGATGGRSAATISIGVTPAASAVARGGSTRVPTHTTATA